MPSLRPYSSSHEMLSCMGVAPFGSTCRLRLLSQLRANLASSSSRIRLRTTSTVATGTAENVRLSPSTFSLFCGTSRSVIRAHSWSQIQHDAGRTLSETLGSLDQAHFAGQQCKEGASGSTTKPATFAWLSAVGPTNDEIKGICQAFNVHPLTVEDVLHRETRDKVELFDRYRFISYSSFDDRPQSATYLQVRNAYILLFPTALVSFHFQPSTHVRLVEKRLAAVSGTAPSTAEGPRQDSPIKARADWVAYALLDVITDAFRPPTEAIERDVEVLEDALLSPLDGNATAATRMLREIGSCRGKTLRLRRLLGEKREVLTSLRKRTQRDPSSPVQEIDMYLSDVQDHLLSTSQDLAHFEDSLSRAQSNCLVSIQIQSTESSNRTSNALSKLTVLGTVLVPLNIITGVWGMNVRVPGQDVDSLFWFVAITSTMACVAFCASLWARRFLRGEVRRVRRRE